MAQNWTRRKERLVIATRLDHLVDDYIGSDDVHGLRTAARLVRFGGDAVPDDDLAGVLTGTANTVKFDRVLLGDGSPGIVCTIWPSSAGLLGDTPAVRGTAEATASASWRSLRAVLAVRLEALRGRR